MLRPVRPGDDKSVGKRDGQMGTLGQERRRQKVREGNKAVLTKD